MKLTDLPIELFHLIASHCNNKTLIKWSITSKKSHDLWYLNNRHERQKTLYRNYINKITATPHFNEMHDDYSIPENVLYRLVSMGNVKGVMYMLYLHNFSFREARQSVSFCTNNILLNRSKQRNITIRQMLEVHTDCIVRNIHPTHLSAPQTVLEHIVSWIQPEIDRRTRVLARKILVTKIKVALLAGVTFGLSALIFYKKYNRTNLKK